MIVKAGDVLQEKEFKLLYLIKFEDYRIHYHHMQYESTINDEYFIHNKRWVVA